MWDRIPKAKIQREISTEALNNQRSFEENPDPVSSSKEIIQFQLYRDPVSNPENLTDDKYTRENGRKPQSESVRLRRATNAIELKRKSPVGGENSLQLKTEACRRLREALGLKE